MNYKIYIHIAFLFFSLSMQSQALNLKANLEQVAAYYKNKDTYQLEVHYSLYNEETQVLSESYKGYIYKQGALHSIRMLGSDVLYSGKAHLTVDHNHKAMRYTVTPTTALGQSPLKLFDFLKYFKITASHLKSGTRVYELERIASPLHIPYSKIVLYIDASNYSLKKQILYLSKKVPFAQEGQRMTNAPARMEVVFRPLLKQSKPPLFEDYIIRKPNGTLEVAKAYSSYKFINDKAL